MSFRKYAKAIVERRGVGFDEWMEEIRAQNEGAVPKDFLHRTAKTILRKCDPKQYLLSHATIVASVDTYAPKNVKTGRQMNRGCQIDVRFPDYKVKPECHDLINNNGDFWGRSLLLSTYRTFIGAPNYCEHIQLPELSKGFIVDAIARDLGRTCYVDILVATDRKHKLLIQDILSGSINALSMGSITMFTVCSKCGNVASDDKDLCPCILYDGKLSKYIDEDEIEHPVSEQCGHVSIPNSNQFIEASWVRQPAFRGAVRRNILNADMSLVATRIQSAKQVYDIRSQIPEMEGMKKAASTHRHADQFQDMLGPGSESDQDSEQDVEDQGTQSQDQGQSTQSKDQGENSQDNDEGASDNGAEKSDKFDAMLDKITEQVLTSITDKLADKLAPKPEDVGTVKAVPPIDLVSNNNDSLVRSSIDFTRLLRKKFASNKCLTRWAERTYKIVHEGGSKAIRTAGLTPRDLIILSWIEDQCQDRIYPPSLYKTAMQVGPSKNFPSLTSYIAACKMKLGRNLSNQEILFLDWKGKVASV